MRLTRIVTLFLLSCLFLPLSGCGDSEEALPTLADDAVVLAFGDSLTFGSGAQKKQSYPVVLEGLIGKKVISAGVPGETSSEGLARLPQMLADSKPDLVILCHGGNDLLRKLNQDHLAQHLTAMIKLIQQSGAEVILVAVPQPSLLLKDSPVYTRVAKENQVPLLTNTLSDVLADPSLKADPIHPNAQGYQHLARAIAQMIR